MLQELKEDVKKFKKTMYEQSRNIKNREKKRKLKRKKIEILSCLEKFTRQDNRHH